MKTTHTHTHTCVGQSQGSHSFQHCGHESWFRASSEHPQIRVPKCTMKQVLLGPRNTGWAGEQAHLLVQAEPLTVYEAVPGHDATGSSPPGLSRRLYGQHLCRQCSYSCSAGGIILMLADWLAVLRTPVPACAKSNSVI